MDFSNFSHVLSLNTCINSLPMQKTDRVPVPLFLCELWSNTRSYTSCDAYNNKMWSEWWLWNLTLNSCWDTSLGCSDSRLQILKPQSTPKLLMAWSYTCWTLQNKTAKRMLPPPSDSNWKTLQLLCFQSMYYQIIKIWLSSFNCYFHLSKIHRMIWYITSVFLNRRPKQFLYWHSRLSL